MTNTPNTVFVPEKDEIILHALERRVAAAVLVDVEILIFARGLDGGTGSGCSGGHNKIVR